MRTLKVLTTKLTASLDSFINEVENQEAIVESMIKDIKQAKGVISIQIKDTQRSINRSKKELSQINEGIMTWKSRAKEIHELDPEKAKECVKKIVSLKREVSGLEKEIHTYEKSLTNLNKEKDLVSKRLSDVELKKRQLICQEERMKVGRTHSNDLGNSDLEETFKRWENKLIIKESHFDSIHLEEEDDRDELEVYFDEKKTEEAIEEELQSILKES